MMNLSSQELILTKLRLRGGGPAGSGAGLQKERWEGWVKQVTDRATVFLESDVVR